MQHIHHCQLTDGYLADGSVKSCHERRMLCVRACVRMCECLKPAFGQQTARNRPAFHSWGCGENPEVRARLRPLLLHLTLSAPPPHKAAIFPLFFFSGSDIFRTCGRILSPVCMCVCRVESAYMRLPSFPRAQPTAHLWTGWEGK